MKGNKYILLIMCALLGIGIVITLHFIRLNTQQTLNGFSRNLISSPRKIKTIDLQYPNYYIAGSDSINVYLANYAAPALISELRIKTFTISRKKIKDAENLPVNWRQVKTTTKYSYYYLMDGGTPNILQGNLSTRETIYTNDWQYGFYQAIPVSETSFIILDYDSALKKRELHKIAGGIKQGTTTPILIKQIDGVFCTDGRLYADPYSNEIVYMYYYRNQFICLDTSLTITYAGNTIDTNSTAKIKLGKLFHGAATSFAAPPLMVNKAGCLAKDVFYVHSNLRADNEPLELFRKNCIIDAYNVKSGQYLSSFYLPKINKECPSDFIISNNILIALYKQRLLAFQLVPVHPVIDLPPPNAAHIEPKPCQQKPCQ